jgi:hypothetical protein
MLPYNFSMIISPTFTAAGASIFSVKSSDGSGGGLLLLSSGLVFGDASSLITTQR